MFTDLNIHIKNRGKKKIVKLHTCQRCYFVSCAKFDFDAHVKKASCKRVASPEQIVKTRPVVTKKQSSKKKTKLDDLEDNKYEDDEDKENATAVEDAMPIAKKPKLNTSKVMTREINGLDDL